MDRGAGYSPWGYKESDTAEQLTEREVLFNDNSIVSCRVEFVCCQKLQNLQSHFPKSSLYDIKRTFVCLQKCPLRNFNTQKKYIYKLDDNSYVFILV